MPWKYEVVICFHIKTMDIIQKQMMTSHFQGVSREFISKFSIPELLDQVSGKACFRTRKGFKNYIIQLVFPTFLR